MKQNTKKIKETILNTEGKEHSVELKRNLIFDFIKRNPHCTIYKIAKGTETNYSQTHEFVRGLYFLRLICKTQGVDSNGEPCPLYFVPGTELTEEEKMVLSARPIEEERAVGESSLHLQEEGE